MSEALFKDGEEISINGEIHIAYICDQKAKCKNSKMCGKECKHTVDIKYAKNFKILQDKRYFIELE